jgi:hypothetical protein
MKMADLASAAAEAASGAINEDDDSILEPPPDYSRTVAAVLAAVLGEAHVCCTQACKGRGQGFLSGEIRRFEVVLLRAEH